MVVLGHGVSGFVFKKNTVGFVGSPSRLPACARLCLSSGRMTLGIVGSPQLLGVLKAVFFCWKNGPWDF